ncbi:hypothetical protein COU15_01215 [Candidatus Kaiserbacteria bacterium CG10_big_fil_rev_8_21_14_0_10_45_20]|uniref:Uncharacterized protein n=1 Tax=Candidatus Kaiserbacteria bacterium CG10_big_fil_rev_8_21_14_0_10_45_20 TaxID=1974607 RepID=A0A2H0UG14_9BACT|nr:MAG: hypothetical protein COU15_01215 [Candidatus Kaiserbacteria bacterium CG10_big_fil_rev_8_21_14_0_10_45_20]
MKKDVVIIIVGIILFAFVWGVWSFLASKQSFMNGAPFGVACTADAKLCPDGSSVGRVGPHCEFAECSAVLPDTP